MTVDQMALIKMTLANDTYHNDPLLNNTQQNETPCLNFCHIESLRLSTVMPNISLSNVIDYAECHLTEGNGTIFI
jgi:hypothetical protein